MWIDATTEAHSHFVLFFLHITFRWSIQFFNFFFFIMLSYSSQSLYEKTNTMNLIKRDVTATCSSGSVYGRYTHIYEFIIHKR